jgi:chlorite dismutase/heme-degrading monooxygenase HmoA
MTGERREAPPTEEGWFALHDFRAVDWDAWRDAPERERAAAVEEGRSFLADALDPEEGASALYTVTGHKADLLVVHLRPTLADVETLERQFERTALGGLTDQTTSFVSVTEASGYSEQARGYFEEDAEIRDGLRRYIETRLYPEIPDAEYVCFYPMDKRRDPEQNWYDLPFDERAEHMEAHGDVGREYGGKVRQMITGSIALDDWEWGVTLWGDDPTQFKKLLYDMRFDPSSSKFAEFGPFYVGQRFAPADLERFLAGERLGAAEGADVSPAHPADAGDAHGEGEHGHAGHGDEAHGEGADEQGHAEGGDPGGPPPGVTGGGDGESEGGEDDEGDIRGDLADLNVYAGQPSGEDVYALVLYSEAGADDLYDEVEGLRGNFEHYDTHVKTAVYEPTVGDHEQAAIVSIWDTQSAADTAAGFLSDLPGVVGRADEGDGWGTMGMFYTVKDDHVGEFREKFGTVGEVLGEMDGHRGTALLANVENDADMFIDSRWDAREDAMGFFRSDEFADTVDWGRDVLADRPRHVFMA